LVELGRDLSRSRTRLDSSCRATLLFQGEFQMAVSLKSSSLIRSTRAALLCAAASFASLGALASVSAHAEVVSPRAITPVASGFNNPRGLKFGPDGALYVAEGGTGGANTTVGQCEQVPPPLGPYSGSDTGGRISRIAPNGVVTTVIDTLPSSMTSALTGHLTSGVGDIAFINGTMYAVLAGAGCSHGIPSMPNGVVRIDPATHRATMIANLSAFQQAHQTLHEEEDDFEPDGTWYSMIAVNGALYAVEPNHGEIDKITTDGTISRVSDISASQGHVVPTALAYHGNFYVGNLSTFPQDIGSSKVWKVNPGAQIKAVASGFDMIVGLVIDDYSRVYVLELAANSPAPAPGAGRITRIQPSGKREIIADGLMFPTAMTLGPDGNLYVSIFGLGGPGQVVMVDLSHG